MACGILRRGSAHRSGANATQAINPAHRHGNTPGAATTINAPVATAAITVQTRATASGSLFGAIASGSLFGAIASGSLSLGRGLG